MASVRGADLPQGVRAEVVGWTRQSMDGRADLRAVPEAALHVTLAFLGGVEAARVAEVWEAVGGACEGRTPPVLTADAVTGLPPRRPCLLAVGLDDEGGRAGTLQDAVANALSARGRRFWPHVTVARVRRGARSSHLASDAPVLEPFPTSMVTLHRSRAGADYEVLERLELRRPPVVLSAVHP